MSSQTIDTSSNPQLAAEIAAKAVAEAQQAPAAALQPISIKPPPDTDVTLFAGIVNQLQGELGNKAVVRELTGSDEEALAAPAATKSLGKYLQTLAARGTVSVDGRESTPELIDGLLIGDREMLLVAIRRVTYGPILELATRCEHCDAVDEEFELHLDDIPIRPLAKAEDAIYGFEVKLPSGRTAQCVLPKAADQDALLSDTKKNPAELDTLMLSRCVIKVGDDPVMSEGQVRGLPVRDRRHLIKELNDRTPGPRIGEAKRTCGSCEQEFGLNLGLLDLFRV